MAKVNLPKLFDGLAEELRGAVQRGRILHGTANIRDSGGPLEHRFRDLIGGRLPLPYRMSTGYLFDGTLDVTPQIDAMICDAHLSHEMLSSNDGASYLPYLSARVLFEIKNSVGSPAKDLAQIVAIANAVKQMRSQSLRVRPGSLCDPA